MAIKIACKGSIQLSLLPTKAEHNGYEKWESHWQISVFLNLHANLRNDFSWAGEVNDIYMWICSRNDSGIQTFCLLCLKGSCNIPGALHFSFPQGSCLQKTWGTLIHFSHFVSLTRQLKSRGYVTNPRTQLLGYMVFQNHIMLLFRLKLLLLKTF